MKTLNKSRVAAIGMAGALAVGTVASLGAITPAGAANTTYTCTLPIMGAVDLPVSTPSPLPAEMLPGEVVPAHAEQVRVTLPDNVVGGLKFLGYSSVSGTVTDTAYTVGSGTLPLTGLTAPDTALPAAGSLTLPMTGQAGAFTAPTTLGSLPVSLPSTFTFIPATPGGPIASVPCVLKTGTSSLLGTSNVVAKYSSKTVAKLKNAPITTAKHAKIGVKVVNGNGAAAAGTVVAKEGTKTLAKGTLGSTGKKTLVLPLLKKGFHKIVVKYKGNATTTGSKDVVKFTIKR